MGGSPGTAYLQAVEKELHAIEVEEHLTVVGRLVCDVPQGAPGELHDLVTLWGITAQLCPPEDTWPVLVQKALG